MTGDAAAPELNRAMVEALRGQGCIGTTEVAGAFRAVPRHLFVPAAPLAEAYSPGTVVPTHFDADGLSISSSSAPNIMAIMLEQLRVGSGMRVLEIGAGTGYNAGLLAHLVGTSGEVVTVDLDEQIVTEARQHLRSAGLDRVRVVRGDGWLGSGATDEFATDQFDRVILTVGAWEISPHWFEQLRVGGILVMPLWLRPGAQMSVALVRDEARLHSEGMCFCGFMRLRGPHAGPDSHVAVSGWGDRVAGATPERHWIAALESADPDRIGQLRSLLGGPVTVGPAPRPAAGWTTRLALEQPDVIAMSGRDTPGLLVYGLFSPGRNSLALFDAGNIVSFGDPYCGERLRARLAELTPLDVRDLDIQALPHPAPASPGAWILERPHFDLVVRAPANA